MSWGAMFLPRGVTIRSFLRPVIAGSRPSSAPRSPECIHPSSISSAVARVVAVAGAHVRPAHQDLAVVGDAHLDAGQRRPRCRCGCGRAGSWWSARSPPSARRPRRSGCRWRGTSAPGRGRSAPPPTRRCGLGRGPAGGGSPRPACGRARRGPPDRAGQRVAAPLGRRRPRAAPARQAAGQGPHRARGRRQPALHLLRGTSPTPAAPRRRRWAGRRGGPRRTVARPRANQVSPPEMIWPMWLTQRSAMCDSGRNDRKRSVGPHAAPPA